MADTTLISTKPPTPEARVKAETAAAAVVSVELAAQPCPPKQPTYPDGLTSRLGHFVYNLDRAVASLIWPNPQETISSQLARRRGHWWSNAPCWVLDKINPGHCDAAIAHADHLNSLDDGVYK